MKKIIISSLLVVSLGFIGLCSFWLGYYKGVNDTAFIIHSNGALTKISTIRTLQKGNSQKAKEINISNLEADIAALEDINSLSGKHTKIPERIWRYRESFSLWLGPTFKKNTVAKLRPIYEELKKEKRFNQKIKRTD